MYKVIEACDVTTDLVNGCWLIVDNKKCYMPGIQDIGKVIDFENETVEFPKEKLARCLNRVMTRENSK